MTTPEEIFNSVRGEKRFTLMTTGVSTALGPSCELSQSVQLKLEQWLIKQQRQRLCVKGACLTEGFGLQAVRMRTESPLLCCLAQSWLSTCSTLHLPAEVAVMLHELGIQDQVSTVTLDIYKGETKQAWVRVCLASHCCESRIH